MGVNLTKENDTGGGSAGEHSVEGEEGLVLVLGEELAADAAVVEIGSQSAQNADQKQRQQEFFVTEGAEIDITTQIILSLSEGPVETTVPVLMDFSSLMV